MGIHHMAVICDYDENNINNKDGKTMVWGRNHKGQLGIGSREQCSQPEELTKLQYFDTRLIDVKCGLSFTLGLTMEMKLMYFGNEKYCLKREVEEDVLEPIEIDEPKQKTIEQISVCYNKILVKTTKGEVYHYGEFLTSKMDAPGQKSVPGGKVQYRAEAIMKDICAGPYHCSTVTMGSDMYSWGLDRIGSTGLPIKKEQYNKRMNRLVKEPRIVAMLSKEFENNKEKNRLLNENYDELYENKIPDSAKEEAKITESEQVDDDEEEKIITGDADQPLALKGPGNTKSGVSLSHKKKDIDSKKNKQIVLIQRPVTNEDIQIFHNFVKMSKFRLISISKGNKFKGLHRYLVDEKMNKCDELSIIRLNKRLFRFLDQILNTVRTSIEIQQYRTKHEFKIESSFISRVTGNPFNIDSTTSSNLKIPPEHDLMIDFMTAIYIHPCYLNSMINHELLSDNELYDIISEIYESQANFKSGYLISFTLTALTRDIDR